MNRLPDYSRATNAAYNVLRTYTGPYPQIDIFKVIADLPDVTAHTYSDVARKFGMTLHQFLDIVSSEYGFTFYDQMSRRGIILFNDLKGECTIRFTVAHELGHIILGHTQDDDIARCEADCFARNFLCPVPLRNGFNLATVEDYCDCFNVSEPMAQVTLNLNKSDNYYITKSNYDNVDNNAYCYLSGFTLAELYGY